MTQPDWTSLFLALDPFRRAGYAAAVGVFGLLVGSFCNVAIYRWPRGLSLIRPGSACPACGHPVRTRDNIPVLGWLWLRGRCRDCGAPISVRYPLVELLTGGLWAAAAWKCWPLAHAPGVNAGLTLTFLVFVTLLLVATFIDFDVQLIPDEVSLGGAAFVAAAALAWPELHVHGRLAPPAAWWFPAMGPRFESFVQSLLGMAVGAGILWIVKEIGTFCFRRRIAELRKDDPELDAVMGLGDLKLMLLAGGFLGPRLTLAALLWAIFAGGAAGFALKYASGTPPPDTRPWTWARARGRWESGAAIMPMGPYLSLGALVMAFGGDPLLLWMLRLYNLAPAA